MSGACLHINQADHWDGGGVLDEVFQHDQQVVWVKGGLGGVLNCGVWILIHQTDPGGQVQRVADEDQLVLHNEKDRMV